MPRRPGSAARLWPRLGLTALLAAAAAGCAAFAIQNQPINTALTDATSFALAPPPAPKQNFEDTAIGLSFSGGGTRAAAFAYGVLREMAATEVRAGLRRTNLADQVDFVSSVSGGSVTAAYFALRGQGAFRDFRQKFLVQDVEASLRTSVDLASLLTIGQGGGLNDRTGLQTFLDANLLHGATYADIFRRGRPVLWINASDIYNRTPFVFNQHTFSALCSDLSKFPLSEAVAASAAVPLIFAPANITNFADRCRHDPPAWYHRALSSADAPAVLRANAEAVRRYREKREIQFVKLLDGGLTDNLGLTGLLIERLAAETPYGPFDEREAVKLRRLLFVVVDAGRPPGGDWAKQVEGPGASDLVLAVTDTAVDANVRNAFDAFIRIMMEWREAMLDWRCSLPAEKVARLRGSAEGWDCQDLGFEVIRVGFDQMPDAPTRERLDAIPTRFKLPEADIDLLLSSASIILRNHPGYRRFVESFGR